MQTNKKLVQADVDTLEAMEQSMIDGYYTVECPHCNSGRNIEIDCESVLDCSGCGREYYVDRVI